MSRTARVRSRASRHSRTSKSAASSAVAEESTVSLAPPDSPDSARSEGEDVLRLGLDDGLLAPRAPRREDVPELDHCVLPAMHRAARDGQLALLSALLRGERADVNTTDAAHQTALHFGCASLRPEATGIVQALVAAGANPNAKDMTGSTPLHNAVRTGSTATVEFLVGITGSTPLNLNVSDVYMDTPLHIAARFGRLDVVRLLLDAGATMTILNLAGQTPSDLAKELNRTAIVELFIQRRDAARLEGHGES
mmetsp:Transcript_7351/g.23518  ORF Transcript_7351/g.23518 Transcript_7351/m.23518 type:complete len:252 (-) Transcript_7351:356-1111(-)